MIDVNQFVRETRVREDSVGVRENMLLSHTRHG
jgi:hypothetical protein